MCRLPEEIAADESDHAGIAADVVAKVEDERVGVTYQPHRGNSGRAAVRRGLEGVEFHVAHVARQHLNLPERAVVTSLLLRIGGEGVVRSAGR